MCANVSLCLRVNVCVLVCFNVLSGESIDWNPLILFLCPSVWLFIWIPLKNLLVWCSNILWANHCVFSVETLSCELRGRGLRWCYIDCQISFSLSMDTRLIVMSHMKIVVHPRMLEQICERFPPKEEAVRTICMSTEILITIGNSQSYCILNCEWVTIRWDAEERVLQEEIRWLTWINWCRSHSNLKLFSNWKCTHLFLLKQIIPILTIHKMKVTAFKSTVVALKDCYEYEAICPHDSLRFHSVEEWKSHHREQHMDTKWKCPLCGTESASWYNYSFHVQISKHKSVCPPPWVCKLDRLPHTNSFGDHISCGARYGSKYQLIRHIGKCHSNYRVCSVGRTILVWFIVLFLWFCAMICCQLIIARKCWHESKHSSNSTSESAIHLSSNGWMCWWSYCQRVSQCVQYLVESEKE